MAPIDEALGYLRSLDPEEKINYTQIAKKFGVDRSTLSRRYRQVNGSKEDQYYAQALLSKNKSTFLIDLVNEFAKQGVSLSNARLAEFAKVLSGKEPGKNWASRWVKHHSDKLIPVQQREEKEEGDDEEEGDEEEDEEEVQALRERVVLLTLEKEMHKIAISRLTNDINKYSLETKPLDGLEDSEGNEDEE